MDLESRPTFAEVFFDFSLKFQISIGQGWGGTARTDGTARTGPSPGQLKFEILKLRIDSSTMTTTTTTTTTITTTTTKKIEKHWFS